MYTQCRNEVIRQCHDTNKAGNFYFWKAVNKVKWYFTWAGLSKDVQVYCKACHISATRRTAGWHKKAEMCRYDVGFPIKEVAKDLMGPFPWFRLRKQVHVVDSFYMQMEAYPITNIVAKTVVEQLVLKCISRFRVLCQIKSDPGWQFDSELFRKMWNMSDINHQISTKFHPQENSRVERMVKVVRKSHLSFLQDLWGVEPESSSTHPCIACP